MDISSMLEVQVNEVKEADIKENVTPRDLHPCTTNTAPQISIEESNFYELMFGNDVSLVRFKKLHCTACDIHIGSAPVNSDNMFQHPILRTLLCAKCHDFYGDGTFEQGDDATDMFCRWCANGGNLYCCSYCSNTFCSKCIRRNFDSVVRKKIEADEKWKCFVCNPVALYSARAVCWALLQYVESVTRLVQTDRHMSPSELEAKMNTDESQCCPRRRKRKRRRTVSNSEDEDETYIPTKVNETSIVPKRKMAKKTVPNKVKLRNGIVRNFPSVPIPIRPRITLQQQNTLNHSEMQPSLLPRDHLIIDRNMTVINPDGSNVAISSNSDSNVLQMPMYNTGLVNAGTTTYFQANSSMTPTRHMISSSNQATTAANSTVQYQSTQRTQAPMVTIPNQSANMINRTRVLLAKRIRLPAMTVTPNIIDLDSDMEEQAAGQSISNNENQQGGNLVQGPAVPVALVRTENTAIKERKQEVFTPRIIRSITTDRVGKTFNQRMLPHGREIDFILSNLKVKLHSLFENSKRDESKKTDLTEARQTITRFHREIRNAVTQLAHINDRVVREYNKWKRCQLKRNFNRIEISKNKTIEISNNVKIPLDMVCVNESDDEPIMENCDETEHILISPSDLVGATNVVEDIVFFRKKKTMDRAVGTSLPITFDDKSVHNVVSQDYEECIGHSVVSRPDNNPEANSDTSELFTTSREHFGKYEEEFISYLQQIEDGRMESVESNSAVKKSDKTSSDVQKVNSPDILNSTIQIEENMKNVTGKSRVVSSKDATCNGISNKVNNEVDTKKKSTMPIIRVLNESLKESNRQKEENTEYVENRINIVKQKQLNCGTNNDETDINSCIDSEEDCTIIDE